MTFLFFALSLISIFTIVPSCKATPQNFQFSEKRPLTHNRDRELLPIDAKINFQILKKSILDKKCLSCHRTDRKDGPAANVDFTTYNTLMEAFPLVLLKGQPLKSRLYTSLLANAKSRMPLGARPLHPREISYIKEFIQKCAPEFPNTPNPCSSHNDNDDDDDLGNDDLGDDDLDNDEL